MSTLGAIVTVNGSSYVADLKVGIDLSIAVTDDPDQTNAYLAHPVRIEPYRSGNWIGSVKAGGPVNYNNIHFNPHGHGTHTECVGHISAEGETINRTLSRWMFIAQLITVKANAGGSVGLIEFAGRVIPGAEALIIRTGGLPQHQSHKWSGTSPPFLAQESVTSLIGQGIDHILIDLPSIDPESDGGALLAHRAFWTADGPHRTLTELIKVPSTLEDGLYLLNLQVAAFENDAAPGRPVVHVLRPT